MFTGVCLSTGGWQTPSWADLPRQTPLGRHSCRQTRCRQTPPLAADTPPQNGHWSGWYASYWNAFLFTMISEEDFSVTLNSYFIGLKTPFCLKFGNFKSCQAKDNEMSLSYVRWEPNIGKLEILIHPSWTSLISYHIVTILDEKHYQKSQNGCYGSTINNTDLQWNPNITKFDSVLYWNMLLAILDVSHYQK